MLEYWIDICPPSSNLPMDTLVSGGLSSGIIALEAVPEKSGHLHF